jgi:hypothetical protein
MATKQTANYRISTGLFGEVNNNLLLPTEKTARLESGG